MTLVHAFHRQATHGLRPISIRNAHRAGTTCTLYSRRKGRFACRATTRTELGKRRVAELRELCAERGLPTSGLKAELVERLFLAQDDGPHVIPEASTSGKGAEYETRGTQGAPAPRATPDTPARFPYSVTWLGTSSGAPTSRRNVSSMALRLSPTSVVLVDCGEGTRNQLRTANIPAGDISHIFITHLHGTLSRQGHKLIAPTSKRRHPNRRTPRLTCFCPLTQP